MMYMRCQNALYKTELCKKKYPEGAKIRLIEMKGEPQMPNGLIGTVTFVDDWPQIHVHWENGSSLALDPDEDKFEIV